MGPCLTHATPQEPRNHGQRVEAVLMSPVEFDRLTYESRVAAAVEEGLDDASRGRVLSDEELRKLADERYGPASRPTAKRR